MKDRGQQVVLALAVLLAASALLRIGSYGFSPARGYGLIVIDGLLNFVGDVLVGTVILASLAGAGLLIRELFDPQPPRGDWTALAPIAISFLLAMLLVWFIPQAIGTGLWEQRDLMGLLLGLATRVLRLLGVAWALHSAFLLLREYIRHVRGKSGGGPDPGGGS